LIDNKWVNKDKVKNAGVVSIPSTENDLITARLKPKGVLKV
jgi:hypothetical protein